MAPTTIFHGLSGFGPRNAQLLVAMATSLNAWPELAAKCRELGIVFSIEAFEKNTDPGAGNAFQIDCDAAVNTGVTGLPPITGAETLDPELKAIIDLSSTVAEFLRNRDSAWMSDLECRNPLARNLLSKATNADGSINTATACITRGDWGLLQAQMIDRLIAYIDANMADLLKIKVHYRHETTAVGHSRDGKPWLKIVNMATREEVTREFDTITCAHGTPLVSSVCGPAAPAYEATPNHSTLAAALQEAGVLENGYIKPGKRILVTGASLSSYDYQSLLLSMLPAFKLSPDAKAGYEFNPEITKIYKGAITIVSRGNRGPAPPRTGPNQTWRGKEPFFSTEEMHVLSMMPTGAFLPIAVEFLHANVAYSLGKLPGQVDDKNRTFAEVMAAYAADTTQYLDEKTGMETDLLRAGYLSFSTGAGLETDPAAAEAALVAKAPLSRKGRAGWPLFTAIGTRVSRGRMIDSEENTAFFGAWDDLHHFIAASPVFIQHAMAELFNLGIAVHCKADFGEIGKADDKPTLRGQTYDVLLSPKSIRRDADPLLASIGEGVKTIRAGVPDYGKGMYLKRADGTPMSVFDGGMGGWGGKFRSDDGETRTAGEQWNDTNNHGAAQDFAVRRAKHAILLALAKADRPDTDPVQQVEGLYRQHLPSPAAFAEEQEKFRPIWDEVQMKLIFLRQARQRAGDDADAYGRIMANIYKPETRGKYMRSLSSGDRDAFQATTYRTFRPMTLQEFERRFVSYTTKQLDDMTEMMLAQLNDDADE